MNALRQPTIAAWAAHAIEQQSRATRLVEGLDAAELVRRPAPGKWGVAHCLEHLALTLEMYEPYISGAIERAAAEGPPVPSPYRPGRLARWLIRAVGPGGRPVPAPRIFRPAEGDGSPEAPERFAEMQSRYLDWLERADRVDLQSTKLRTPVSPILRLRLGVALELMLRHTDRHLAQAERARARTGTPA